MVAAGEDEASILGIDPGAPLLSITRTTKDGDGAVFEYSHDSSAPTAPSSPCVRRRLHAAAGAGAGGGLAPSGEEV